MTVKFCTRCVISDRRPRITFDAEGVCSACRFAEYKATVDWAARDLELVKLCNKHRKDDGSFDVIVPVSGGKDGGFVAHQLKHKYGMHPLCVTWAPLLYTDIGRRNLDAFIASGFDHILGTPERSVTRKLTRLAFEHMGDPFLPFIYGQTNFPLQMAVRYEVPLIMYGENGEVEYGGDMKNAYKPTREIADHDTHYFSGKGPAFWASHGVPREAIARFQAPPFEYIKRNETEIHFFSYYHRWTPQENFYYCSEHTGFTPNPERTEGTYSKYASLDDKLDGLHYFLGFLKFGIGRSTSDAAHEVRDGHITREEAVALVHRFDGEFPQKYFAECCEYMGISEIEARLILSLWRGRSPDVWDGDRLRYQVA